MTSEQILKLIDEPGPMEDRRALPLWELAYQFAIYNERNAAIDEQNAELDARAAEVEAKNSSQRQDNNARLMEMLASFAQRLDLLEGPRFPPGAHQ